MNEDYWRQTRSPEQIKAMVLEQHQAFCRQTLGIERDQLAEVRKAIGAPQAVIISGLRRVGKSTLLAQTAHLLGESNFYYLNFEDDRFLGFHAADFNDLYLNLVEIFGEHKIFMVDEIQNIPGWEHFVRRFMDMGFKFFITGSNASLLSRELGSRLTGRYLTIDLFPFSFHEFLRFQGEDVPDLKRLTTPGIARLNKQLGEYLRLGGLPEPLQYPELPLRRSLYDDVLYRDIAARYRIEEIRALKELGSYLMSNPASLVSFNKLKEQFRLGSVNTIKNYIEYMENSWLFFLINVFDYSVKRQQIAPKKVYAIDTGMIQAVGFSFSANSGKLLENLAFLKLRQKNQEIFYYQSPGGNEVDFYIPEKGHLLQVTQNLNQPTIWEREIKSLVTAMRALKLSKGVILTDTEAPPVKEDGLLIEIRSLAQWLLNEA
jgi:predicted AAA+ superfamily ATPase